MKANVGDWLVIKRTTTKMANRLGTADRAASGDLGDDTYLLVGIYENSHRVREAWSIGFDDDPRFDDEDDFDEAAHEAARAAAAVAADQAADKLIARGEPIVGTLMRWGWSLHPFRRSTFSVPRAPFFSDRDRKYDIYPDDRVVVNVAATAAWKAKRPAEEAARAAAVRAAAAQAAERNSHRP